MEFDIKEAIEILERTPKVIKEMLQNLSDDWLKSNEGGETWSPYVILGHLIYGEETDWIPRARIILRKGQTGKFDPFDRFAQLTIYNDTPLEDLLNKFRELRKKNIDELMSFKLTKKDLERKGIHPELGEVSLGQLLATWTVHDLNHISQIARVMAKQYHKEVGNWKGHLPILSA